MADPIVDARLRGAGRTGVPGALLRAFVAVLLLMGAASSGAQPLAKQVLLLQSLNRGNLTLDQFTGNFRVGLDQRAGQPVNVVQVVLGPTGSIGASEQALVTYIQSLYSGRSPPDLVMTAGGPAAVFARKYRQQIFPATPLLLASVDQRFIDSAPLGENETAVSVTNDFPGVIDDILRVRPETRQVFMLIGTGSLGQFWRREVEAGVGRFRDRVTFIWSDDMSLAEVLRRCADLPAHSAIHYITFGTDALGGAYADEQVLAELHAKANAPIFAAFSPLIGHGVVGGRVMSVEDHARSAADVAIRLLRSEPAASIRVPVQLATPWMFDWRELQRWEIPESRLPAGSVVKFRGPGLWDEHKVSILLALAALALQSILILRLLYEHRAKQRAELDSRRNLALAADANRRLTISALTSAMGHELAQPLSAVALNSQALRRLAETDRLTRREMREIVADIEGGVVMARQIIDRHRTMLRGHQMLKEPIDLHAVVHESLALVSYDMKARQIEVALQDLPAAPCMVEGDQVLLQQVFVNLLRNAMDALAGTPAAGRRIVIRSAIAAGAVEVSVSDTGTGLTPRVLETLFTPFLTAKADGLGIGLTITRSILEAHGGRIAARANPEGGATFTVTLPLGAAPGR